MLRSLVCIAAVGCIALVGTANVAMAQVGEPVGSFNIVLKQGANVIVNDTVTIGPGGELQDLKATFQDGDPEDYTQIGVIGPIGSTSPIILKVTSDGGPMENFRVLHWYIDVPVSMNDINTVGPYSLFDPNGGNIELSISSLEFSNGALATPQFSDNDTYLVSFMRDVQGHFYESVGANAYNVHGHGIYDIQVPGVRYLDGNLSQYTFASTPGTSSSWTFSNIINPGLLTTIHNGASGGLSPLVPGFVFELGTSIAFTAVPEPASLSLLATGLLLVLRRRR
jgi:hypothetical protein